MGMYLGYWCHPIQEYWAVPVKTCECACQDGGRLPETYANMPFSAQCATYYNHMIFATAWNISSDLALFFIPIPVIAKSQLPLKRKIVLCCVLGLGLLNVSQVSRMRTHKAYH
jgi:hypothetical protein